MGRKLFTLLLGVFSLYIASPLLIPVTMGALFAILLMPIQDRIERSKGSQGWISLFLTLAVTLILIVPISISLYMAAKMAFQHLDGLRTAGFAQGDWLKGILELPGVAPLVEKISNWYPMGSKEIRDILMDLGRAVSSRASETLGSLITHLPGMVLAVLVLCVSLYFFLMDGRKLVMFFRRHSFFDPQQTHRLIHTLEATCRSVLLASIVSGAVQAVFETLVAFLCGISSSVLIGVVVFISSFIPVVGTAPVTFGLAIQQYLSGHSRASLVLFISAGMVAIMDNLIRPWFLRGSVNLHPLLAFVAAFGGLQTLGFSGVFLGPVIAALFVVTVQILVQARADH